MAIVSVFIALMSFLIACLALAFTIGSFWWLNARQGRLMSFEPHSFAACALPTQSKLRLPLVFYNTGAKPIIVQNMQLRFTGNPPLVLPWSTTRSQLMPTADDEPALPATFSIPGRTAQQLFIEFGGPFPGGVPAADCQARIYMKLGHRQNWEQLITFAFWATQITHPRRYIAYPNLPRAVSADPSSVDGT
jgi:hypothetical protein